MDEVDVKVSMIKKAVEYITGEKDAEIVDVHVQRASKEGDGNAAIILRTKVIYRCDADGAMHTKTFVIKMLPEAEAVRKLVEVNGIFEKESSYFSSIQASFRRVAEGRVEIPVPESYFSVCNRTDSLIFLEDLRISGYQMANRKYRVVGMDLPHCEVSMALLGRLHGIAAVCEKTIPEVEWESLKAFKEICFYMSGEGEEKSIVWDIYHNSMGTLVELAKKMEGLPKEAAESGELEKLLGRGWRTLCQLTNAKGKDVPKVACHGDFWMNNIMFRYEEGGKKPLDGKVFDFQVIRHSHPCTDIFHFLYGCVNSATRKRHMDHLLEVYHQAVAETMDLLISGPPFISLDDLKRDAYGEYKVFGTVIGALWHPIFMLDDLFCGDSPEDIGSKKMEDLLENGNAYNVKKKFMENEIYRKEMEEIIKELVDVALPKGMENVECSPFQK